MIWSVLEKKKECKLQRNWAVTKYTNKEELGSQLWHTWPLPKGPTYQYGVPTKELAGAERAAEPKSAEREMDKVISVNELTLEGGAYYCYCAYALHI